MGCSLARTVPKRFQAFRRHLHATACLDCWGSWGSLACFCLHSLLGTKQTGFRAIRRPQATDHPQATGPALRPCPLPRSPRMEPPPPIPLGALFDDAGFAEGHSRLIEADAILGVDVASQK